MAIQSLDERPSHKSGSTFTKNVILDIKDDWLTIILITVMLLALALVIAFFFKKIAKVNTETAILSP
jgi:uncharacterized membrane protein AbrB (regulator of aidB expression)